MQRKYKTVHVQPFIQKMISVCYLYGPQLIIFHTDPLQSSGRKEKGLHVRCVCLPWLQTSYQHFSWVLNYNATAQKTGWHMLKTKKQIRPLYSCSHAFYMRWTWVTKKMCWNRAFTMIGTQHWLPLNNFASMLLHLKKIFYGVQQIIGFSA